MCYTFISYYFCAHRMHYSILCCAIHQHAAKSRSLKRCFLFLSLTNSFLKQFQFNGNPYVWVWTVHFTWATIGAHRCRILHIGALMEKGQENCIVFCSVLAAKDVRGAISKGCHPGMRELIGLSSLTCHALFHPQLLVSLWPGAARKPGRSIITSSGTTLYDYFS